MDSADVCQSELQNHVIRETQDVEPDRNSGDNGMKYEGRGRRNDWNMDAEVPRDGNVQSITERKKEFDMQSILFQSESSPWERDEERHVHEHR